MGGGGGARNVQHCLHGGGGAKSLGPAVSQCLLPTGSEEREVLGVGSIPVALLPSCKDVKNIAL